MEKEIQVKNKLEPSRSLKVAAFDQSKSNTKPHKHNGYLELVLLTKTSGKHVIDGREVKIEAPCLLVIRQDNVHHWDLEKPILGYVLLLKRHFVDASYDPELNMLLDQLVKLDILPILNVKAVETIFQLLMDETNKTCQEGLFKALIAKLLEANSTSPRRAELPDNLYKRFTKLLRADVHPVNHVAHYAEKLHTSPQNLNAACKREASKTASDVLADYLIQEAKRLLIYTGKSISEVAFDLGFSDKSNFSKYFKRYTLQSPKDFRNENLKIPFHQTHS
ncbi:helix-turn-helix domain-containing protein [Sphingobacterium lactis]|uniref:helix-turn-helix domain-containing protein n=1 Tax=Sphingobacterium lactis TaxID=797291 RepID=UPI003F8222F1